MQKDIKIDPFVRSATGSLKIHSDDYWIMDKKNGVFAVADGVGSLLHPGLSSKIVLERIQSEFNGSCYKLLTENHIRDVIIKANDDILRINKKCGKTITATTIACLLTNSNGIYCINIGDSKIFTLSNGKMVQLSVDDNSFYKQANKYKAFTKAIGVSPNIFPHILKLNFLEQSENVFLICSDGIINALNISEIEKIFMEFHSSTKSIATSIIEQVQKKEKHDDATLILVKISKQ